MGRFQGPLTRETAMPRVGPLVERAEGVVLEIGAGTGEWVRCYDKGKVKKVSAKKETLRRSWERLYLE